MIDIIHTEIFFFITSIFVVLLTIFLVVFGIYVIRIVQKINTIAKLAEEEAYEIKDDIDVARKNIKKIMSITYLVQVVQNIFKNIHSKK